MDGPDRSDRSDSASGGRAAQFVEWAHLVGNPERASLRKPMDVEIAGIGPPAGREV
jgi:hypothetical protein